MEALPFHDDHLEEKSADTTKECNNDIKSEKERIDYEPIVIDNLWFERKVPADSDEELTITKFKAHSAYRDKDYQKALLLYEKCSEILPKNANLLLREIGESKVRCLIKLGRFKECEKILCKMFGEKGNPQDSSLQSLSSDVCVTLGDFNDTAKNLRECQKLHPEYSEYWLKTAELFKNLSQSTASFQEHQNLKERESDLSDIWYFVHLIRKSVFSGNFDDDSGKRDVAIDDVSKANELLDIDLKEKACTLDGITVLLNKLMEESSLHCSDVVPCTLEDIETCPCFSTAMSFLDSACPKDQQQNDEYLKFSNAKLFFVSLISKMEPSLDVHKFKNQNGNSEAMHHLLWRCAMKASQFFALGKSCQLLQKTVQYSKGFGKYAEQIKLSKIEEQLANEVGNTELMEWLIKLTFSL